MALNPHEGLVERPNIDVVTPQDADPFLLQLTQRIYDQTLESYGTLAGHCSCAATALTILARKAGYDARLQGGETLRRSHGYMLKSFLEDFDTSDRSVGTWRWWQHSWVLCDGLRLDPTIRQFEGRDEPLVTDEPLLCDWYWVDTEDGPPAKPSLRWMRGAIKDGARMHGWPRERYRHWLEGLELEDALALRTLLTR
jgi:hypothetical protein